MPHPKPTEPPDCAVRDDCPVSSACVPGTALPCEAIGERHAAKLGLCDLLETIADSLPVAVDRAACLRAAADLLPAVRAAQGYEERVLYPAFGRSGRPAEPLRRLRCDHVEDEALAEELTHLLHRIGHGGEVSEPGTLGATLRAFLETMRSHVASERQYVAPLTRTDTA